VTPGVPGSALVPVRSYIWTHNVPAAAGGYVVIPEIYVYNQATTSARPGQRLGFYRFTDVKMERITNAN